jgi:hypothetical protein
LKALVDEVESATGMSIDVRAHSRRPNEVRSVETNVASAGFDPTSLSIEAPEGRGALVTEKEMAHELLHLKRWTVDRVAHIYPRSLSNGPAAADIGNWVEHAVIFGPQMSLVPEMRDDFNQDLQQFWQVAAREEVPNAMSRRMSLLSRAIVTERFGRSDTKAAMRSALREYRQHRVEVATRQAIDLVDDPAALTRFVVDYIGAPRDEFYLRRFAGAGQQMPCWQL